MSDEDRPSGSPDAAGGAESRARARCASTADSPAPQGGAKWERGDETKLDSFADRARQGLHCSLFCGGVKCKHESWDFFCNKKKHNIPAAVEGLNSSWVSEHIVASQRPSSSLFLTHHIVQQFRKHKITGVFNLQEKGEHSSCGPDGIYQDSGYSYNGEKDLMRYGISYYEFPWPDMTAPNNDIVLRSIQVMHHHVLHSGKVLVHCHAGLGRTGLMIACFLIFSYRMKAEEAIQVVRSQRPGSVQTKKQVEFIRNFEGHLRALLQAFRVEVSEGPVEFGSFMKRQRLFLHGDESRLYRYCPRHIHHMVCKQLGDAKESQLSAVHSLESFSPGMRLAEDEVNRLRLEVNQGLFDPSGFSDSVVSFVILDWFRRLSTPAFSLATGQQIVKYQQQMESDREDIEKAVQRLIPDKSLRATVEMVLSATCILGRTGDDSNALHFALNCFTDSLFQFHNRAIAVCMSGHEKHLVYDFVRNWTKFVGPKFFPGVATDEGNHKKGDAATPTAGGGGGGDLQVTDSATLAQQYDEMPLSMLKPSQLIACATYRYNQFDHETQLARMDRPGEVPLLAAPAAGGGSVNVSAPAVAEESKPHQQHESHMVPAAGEGVKAADAGGTLSLDVKVTDEE